MQKTNILTGTSGLQKAKEILLAESIVAIPTETVYGLAGLASSERAIKKIYKIKNRPSINPLISHYADIQEIKKDVELTELGEKLLKKFAPGPLTLVLKRKESSRISSSACAGLETAAVRIPKHDLTLKLLKALGEPVVAPSANPSGSLSPVSAKNVVKLFGDKLDYVLDGGPCEVGLESTVVELMSGSVKILRFGAVTIDDLLTVVHEVKIPGKDEAIKSPGMLLKHYAPKCFIRMGFDKPGSNEGLLAFGSLPNSIDKFSYVKNLSEEASLEEAASNLFKMIHELEELGVDSIAVMPIPDESLGKAINDRLNRAAASGEKS